MNIIVGASGQVGTAIVENLLSRKAPVTALTRDGNKVQQLKDKGALIALADAFDLESLKAAFKDGTTLFILTPETSNSEDVIGDTKTILDNYRTAIEGSSIKKIVGLSSIGAHLEEDSGNLKMSHMLERAFKGLNQQQVFVRPAYYYSNWLAYTDTARAEGALPTFYPVDLRIPMIAPPDVAAFLADMMLEELKGDPIYELVGPEWYHSIDVANAFGAILQRKVEARQVPKDDWSATLESLGFTEDAVKNFIEMTDLVNASKAIPEGLGTIAIKTGTTLQDYLAGHVK